MDPPYELSLGGLGVRSMDYSVAAGAYFVVAGPVDAGNLLRYLSVAGRREAGAHRGRSGESEETERLRARRTDRRPDRSRLRLFGDAGGSGDEFFPERRHARPKQAQGRWIACPRGQRLARITKSRSSSRTWYLPVAGFAGAFRDLMELVRSS